MAGGHLQFSQSNGRCLFLQETAPSLALGPRTWISKPRAPGVILGDSGDLPAASPREVPWPVLTGLRTHSPSPLWVGGACTFLEGGTRSRGMDSPSGLITEEPASAPVPQTAWG